MLAVADLFIRFAALLRANGFPVAPEQTTAFLQAIALLGPRGIADIRRAAHATLAPSPERREEFDALFDAHFLGRVDLVAGQGEGDEDEWRVRDTESGARLAPEAEGLNQAGQAATRAELLGARRLLPGEEDHCLRRLAHGKLPRRRGRRLVAARRGRIPDLRRTLRESVRTEGDVATLRRRRRKMRPRPLLLLIDVSGSMKTRTDAHLRFAHALAQAAERIEVFTLGTRLTRITRALRLRRRAQALEAVSHTVADWDGGTRIGDALQAFLAVPRFAGYARGAAVLIISDGLERGDPANLVNAVSRLSRRAWRLSWLSPLAADARYRPSTEAMSAILPYLDDLAPAATTEAICAHLLALAS
ncbi:MAG: VWA domain-containing protein [Acetobacteraceae bacterium]|nr:VWA domain-containing protein [Acetobacteraceae bacterium]